MSERAVQLRGVHKTYRLGRFALHVLRGVSFDVTAGEFVAIVGASGSGKSTLLHVAGLLDRCDKGRVTLDGEEIRTFSRRRRHQVRRREIGFVFQFYHLMRELNVRENVLLPAMVDSSVAAWGRRRKTAGKRAEEILERLGLQDRLRHRPRELSGGERQRVAIARALINDPTLLLADEPTGNLDSKTGGKILDVLKELNRKAKQTILMVTHDSSIAAQADRILHLRDGRLVE